jgi:hypothetical protein
VLRLLVMTAKTTQPLNTSLVSWHVGHRGDRPGWGGPEAGMARASYRQRARSARTTTTAPARPATPPLTIAIRTEPVSDATSPDSRPPEGSQVGTDS